MVDIDMEVDASHSVDLDLLGDEDLIDFDTDMADHIENEWAQTEGLPQATDEARHAGELVHDETKDVPTFMDHVVDVEVDLEVDGADEILHDADASVNGGDYEFESAKFDVDDGTSNRVDRAATKAEENQGHIHEDTNFSQHAENADAGHVADGAEESGSTHEIDYEFEDSKPLEEPLEEVPPTANGETAADDEEDAGTSIHVKPYIHPAQVGSSEYEDDDDTIVVAHPYQNQADQHEISWDADDNHEAHEGEKKDSNETIEPNSDEDDQAHDEIEVKVKGDTINVRLDGEEYDDAEEQEETNVEEHDGADDAGETEEHEAAGKEQDEEHEEEHEKGHHEKPQGEKTDDQDAAQLALGDQPATEPDFPAITVQYKGDEFPMFSASEGFFTETSILDDAIGTLLAQLRQELANEIAHEDELVLQIDELGLEFAESSLKDSLSTVTLRQLLEIFDLLVKNQDPDSSRTLYTYLFTKPSTSKRLESLMESAAAGRGLDEVIHLFESPMPNNTNVIELDSIPQELEELLDEYDSPEELAPETQEDEPEYVQEDNQDGDNYEDLALDAEGQVNPSIAQNDSTRDDETRSVEAADEEVTLEVVGLVSEEAEAPKLDEINDEPESESDPFVNFDLEAGSDDEVDLVDHGDAGDDNAQGSDVVAAIAMTASTTTTVHENNEQAPPDVDLGIDTAAQESENLAPGDEDELAEIDWRDPLEPAEETPGTPSGAGKRPRGDDEDAGAENEQDAKRRRS